MVKQIWFLLQVWSALLLFVDGAVPEFKYVGQFNGKDYWASLIDYTEPSGKIYLQCRAKFGNTAYTCRIDDAAEWNFVRGQLSANFQCNGCTRNFWTNGKYDRPHAAGENIVITVTGNVVGTKISKVANEYRYICEVPITVNPTTTTTTQAPHSTSQDFPTNPTPVEECEYENDVVVVIDSSGSIGIDNYKKEKVFGYDLSRMYDNRDASRLGFTIFSQSTQIVVPLDNTMSNQEVYARILNATYMGYTTNTDLGIISATNELTSSTRPVTKNLVIITDGLSNNPEWTKAAADTAIGEGIRTFAVGVGPQVQTNQQMRTELLDIAGGNQNNVFTADTFDDLTAILNPVGQAVCNPSN